MLSLTLTDDAREQVQQLIEEQGRDDLSLRVYVSGGGCSGFSYGMGLDDTVKDDDEIVDANGVRILVDDKSAEFLDGIEIDYRESITGGGFSIQNPNAAASCGCGQSFKAKEKEGEPELC